MNEPENDIDVGMPELTQLERELMTFLAQRGIDNPADLDFVIRRIRTTLRVVQLGQALDRSLTGKERGQAFRRLQDGESTEDVLRWLLASRQPSEA